MIDSKSGFILRIKSLTKSFSTVIAVDNVSFDLREGEIHSLLGENGAGKSTLAECLYGFYKPDSGQIFFNDEEVVFSSPRDAIAKRLGMVHQHFILVQPLSVLENIVLGFEGPGIILNLGDARNKVEKMCNEYGIDLDLDAKIWQLSVGEQQWVEIIKALYTGVDLLILDEPTAVLTPQETEKFFTILKNMTSKGLSIIYISHRLNEVMTLSDRVTVLRKGKKVGTVLKDNTTKEELARMMVGRDIVFKVQKDENVIGKPLLNIRDLRAMSDRKIEALRGINLTLHQGEILGLAGVSGNGQKELFEVLVGVRRATGGNIFLDGEEITNLHPQHIVEKGVGHIPEDRISEGLVPDFSIADNLILGKQSTSEFRKGPFLDYEWINAFAKECINSYEIVTPSHEHTTKFLSGGNQQKVIVARELRQQPRCLLANQPTRGLDVGVIEYLHERFLEKRREMVGILLASEDLEELFNLCDRIAVIYKGEIMHVFSSEEFDIQKIGILMAGAR